MPARNSVARVVPTPGKLVTTSPSSCSATTPAMAYSITVMRSLTASRSVAISATIRAADRLRGQGAQLLVVGLWLTAEPSRHQNNQMAEPVRSTKSASRTHLNVIQPPSIKPFPSVLKTSRMARCRQTISIPPPQTHSASNGLTVR